MIRTAEDCRDEIAALIEFTQLFAYDEPNDRAIAIIGPTFLDRLITQSLEAFLVDGKDTKKLLAQEGHLGTFGAKVTTLYCLGLVNATVRDDLRVIAKIRNKFAHDLKADFDTPPISDMCKSLRWHKTLCQPPPGVSARDLYQVGINQLVTYLNGMPSYCRLEQRQARA